MGPMTPKPKPADTLPRLRPNTPRPPSYFDDNSYIVGIEDFDAYQNPLGNGLQQADDSSTESPPTVVVRGEEIGIVIFVLLLWVGAIALFFNRWGKIRMLEPYQPKFCESHRPSCPIADVPPITHFPRTLSKFNLSTETSPHFAKCTYNYYPAPSGSGVMGYNGPTSSLSSATVVSGPYPSTSGSTHYRAYIPQHQRSRQNSVFSPIIPLSNGYVKNASRKTKSAVDLSNLILAEEFVEGSRHNSKISITHL